VHRERYAGQELLAAAGKHKRLTAQPFAHTLLAPPVERTFSPFAPTPR